MKRVCSFECLNLKKKTPKSYNTNQNNEIQTPQDINNDKYKYAEIKKEWLTIDR